MHMEWSASNFLSPKACREVAVEFTSARVVQPVWVNSEAALSELTHIAYRMRVAIIDLLVFPMHCMCLQERALCCQPVH